MSKIGKTHINVPEKVKVVMNGNILNIDGPLGKKSLSIDTDVFELNIKEAREKCDLKENAEYHAAREQQSFMEGRIKDIESKLSNAVRKFSRLLKIVIQLRPA